MDKKRIAELESLLRRASDAYYSGADAIMSDAEFDRQRDELEGLDPHNSFLSQVGAPTASALQKVKHSIPMGSLKKITTEPEFTTWLGSLTNAGADPLLAVQLKLDGLSIELVYENGKFVQAITRGDGYEGEDVTHTIKNAKFVPKTISVTDRRVSVRCEAMLNIGDWKAYFADKANPRNAASGLVRRTDAKGSEHISCIAFDVQINGRTPNLGGPNCPDCGEYHPDGDCYFRFEKDRIDWLEKEKFATTSNLVVKASRAIKAIDDIEAQRDRLPFEIDGAVVKVNEIAVQVKMGEHHGRPYWARAWKFAAMGGHSTVEAVSWSVGTQGTINPVAQIAPVHVGGTTISNVTLHNMDEIDRLGVKIGDKVEVIRAGDVIPKIVRVVAKGTSRSEIAIALCPACGSKAVRDGVNMICSMKDKCEGVSIKKLKKWIKKRRILHLGDSNVESLVAAGVVNGVADLYLLTLDSMKRGGVSEGMAKRILPQIENSKVCSLADLIGSLSMDLLGRSQAKILIENGIDTIAKWQTLTQAQIEVFPGFKATKASRIAKALHDNWKLIEGVAACLTIKSAAPKPTSGKLLGKSFCFTGSMKYPRKDLEAMVGRAGGSIRSVSRALSFLVIADPSSQSSKAVKAREDGVTLISENDFLKMV